MARKITKGSLAIAMAGSAIVASSGIALAPMASAEVRVTSPANGDSLRLSAFTGDGKTANKQADTPETAWNDGNTTTPFTFEFENTGLSSTNAIIRVEAPSYAQPDGTTYRILPDFSLRSVDNPEKAHCVRSNGLPLDFNWQGVKSDNPPYQSYVTSDRGAFGQSAIIIGAGEKITCSTYLLSAVPNGQTADIRLTATQIQDNVQETTPLPNGYSPTNSNALAVEHFYLKGSTDPNPGGGSTTPTVELPPVITSGNSPINGSVGKPIAPAVVSSDDPKDAIAINTNTLPPGLTWDPNTKTISGTPTTVGTGTITGTITDATNGKVTNINIGYAINDTTGPVFTVGQNPPVNQGAQVNIPITTDSPTDTTTLERCINISNGQPVNYFNYNNGALTGSTTTPGTYNCYLKSTDSNGNSTETVVPVTVKDSTAPVITPVNDATATKNTPINPIPVIVKDDSATAVNVTNLPDGLVYNPATGQITGTPTTAGTSEVTVIATDSAGNSSTDTFTVTVTDNATPDTKAPVVTGIPTTVNGDLGKDITPVKVTVDDSAATSTLECKNSTGQAVDYFKWNETTKEVTGGATAPAGSYNCTLTTRDAAGNETKTNFTVNVSDPNAADTKAPVVTGITPNQNVPGEINKPVTIPVTVDDSTATNSLVCKDSAGQTVDYFHWDAATKAVVGTSPKPGVYSCVFSSVDPAGNKTDVPFSITIADPTDTTAPVITPVTVPDKVIVDTPIAPIPVKVDDANAKIDLVCKDSDGKQVNYFTYDSEKKVIVGTAAKEGTYHCTLTATDASGNKSSSNFDIKVSPKDNSGDKGNTAPAVTPIADVKDAVVNVPITPITVKTLDPKAENYLDCANSKGELVDYFTYDPKTHQITGKAPKADKYQCTLQSIDSHNAMTEEPFTITVKDAATKTDNKNNDKNGTVQNSNPEKVTDNSGNGNSTSGNSNSGATRNSNSGANNGASSNSGTSSNKNNSSDDSGNSNSDNDNSSSEGKTVDSGDNENSKNTLGILSGLGMMLGGLTLGIKKIRRNKKK